MIFTHWESLGASTTDLKENKDWGPPTSSWAAVCCNLIPGTFVDEATPLAGVEGVEEGGEGMT